MNVLKRQDYLEKMKNLAHMKKIDSDPLLKSKKQFFINCMDGGNLIFLVKKYKEKILLQLTLT